jgi:serine/threonine protein kinase
MMPYAAAIGEPPLSLQRLRSVASRFEEAWQHAASVDLGKYLPPPGDPERRAYLLELIKTDLRCRWQRGQAVGLEYYLEKFPELGTAADLPTALLAEEFRVRQLCGDAPALAHYAQRFPRQFRELQDLLSEYGKTEASPAPAPPAAPKDAGAADAQFLPVGGGYHLLQLLGKGGFGEVWRAESVGGRIPVAIKKITRSMEHGEAQRELRALEAMRGLSHPFLLSTHSYWMHESRLYIVMELAEGSLFNRFKACRAENLPGIPSEELYGYLHESAEALDYLHGKHVLHRDIKPENILLLQGHVKVADFGLAKLVEHAVTGHTGALTVTYAAPEFFQGKTAHQSDQYSLAVTYCHLRGGRAPFTGSIGKVMTGHLMEPPDLSMLPEAERSVLNRALAKEPDERFPSCVAFVQALQAILNRVPVPPPSPAGVIEDEDFGIHVSGPSSASAVLPQPTSSGHLHETSRPLPERVPPSRSQADLALNYAVTAEPDRPIAPGRSAAPSRRWQLVLALLLVLLTPVAWLVVGQFLGTAGELTLKAPPALKVQAGGKSTFTLEVQRGGHAGAIPLQFLDLPARVQVTPAVVPAGDQVVQLQLVGGPDAEPGTGPFQIQAADARVTVDLTVLPLPTLPRGCDFVRPVKVATDRTGAAFYERVALQRSGLRIEFCLCLQKNKNDPATFYIMKDKVSNGLYRKFVEAHPNNPALKNSVWQKGGQAGGKDLGADNPLLPVLRVTAVEAHPCARWLNGFLPSEEEWKKASGWLEVPRRDGPFQGQWEVIAKDPQALAQIAVRREALGPMPLDQKTLDVSPFGCRHMSGNGLEWTDTILRDVGTVRVSEEFPRFKERDLVVLHGARYQYPVPLLFADHDSEAKSPTQTASDIGFRVVLR